MNNKKEIFVSLAVSLHLYIIFQLFYKFGKQNLVTGGNFFVSFDIITFVIFLLATLITFESVYIGHRLIQDISLMVSSTTIILMVLSKAILPILAPEVFVQMISILLAALIVSLVFPFSDSIKIMSLPRPIQSLTIDVFSQLNHFRYQNKHISYTPHLNKRELKELFTLGFGVFIFGFMTFGVLSSANLTLLEIYNFLSKLPKFLVSNFEKGAEIFAILVILVIFVPFALNLYIKLVNLYRDGYLILLSSFGLSPHSNRVDFEMYILILYNFLNITILYMVFSL